MIVTKQEYTVTDLDLLTPSQHNSESVWASISLKDHSKLIVGYFYMYMGCTIRVLSQF